MDARSFSVLFALVCVAYAWPKQFLGFKRGSDGGIPQDALDGCIRMGYSKELCQSGIKECVDLGISMENCGAHHAQKYVDLCKQYGMNTEAECGAFVHNVMGIQQFCAEESMSEDECKKFGEVWYDGFQGCQAMGYSQRDCIEGFKTCINDWGVDNPTECGEKWKAQSGGDVPKDALEACVKMGYSSEMCRVGIQECVDLGISMENCGAHHTQKLVELCQKYGMDSEEKCRAFAKNLMGIAQFCIEERMSEDECKKFGEVWYAGFEGCEAMGYSQRDCINGFKICINQWGVDNPKDCGEKWAAESGDKDDHGLNKDAVSEILKAGQLCQQYSVSFDDCVDGIWECVQNDIETAAECERYHLAKGDKKRIFSKFTRKSLLGHGFSIKKK